MKYLAPEREKEIRDAIERGRYSGISETYEIFGILLAEIDRLRAENVEANKAFSTVMGNLVKAIAALEELDAYGMPEHIAVGIRQTLKELKG